ncbi:hypothetical protein XENORESO_013515 [Xenotaenia resolanae]|uniref:Uncharacterized protein n=1 Tax=Xenotaenia resolanae TaxID=208358 RepID=A0ABV0W4D8_9TELE
MIHSNMNIRTMTKVLKETVCHLVSTLRIKFVILLKTRTSADTSPLSLSITRAFSYSCSWSCYLGKNGRPRQVKVLSGSTPLEVNWTKPGGSSRMMEFIQDW